jgi:hypothetical protein
MILRIIRRRDGYKKGQLVNIPREEADEMIDSNLAEEFNLSKFKYKNSMLKKYKTKKVIKK